MEYNLKNILEALLFAAGDPISTRELAESLDVDRGDVMRALDELAQEYAQQMRGIRLVFMDDKVQMSTREMYAPTVEDVLAPIRIQSLTQSAIEVLSIVAYKQPVTRGEIADIRGVRSDYVIGSLLRKGLIREAGKKDTIGHPTLFRTTDLFLRDFNLSDLTQLPQLEVLQPKTDPPDNEEVESVMTE